MATSGTQRYSSRRAGHAFEDTALEDANYPKMSWLHLDQTLYSLTHPIKVEGYGDNIPEQVHTAFIKEMRREVASGQ